jgi:hypothetical protein
MSEIFYLLRRVERLEEYLVATLADVQAAVAAVSAKVDACKAAVDAIPAGGIASADAQALVDSVAAVGAKVDAVTADAAGKA